MNKAFKMVLTVAAAAGVMTVMTAVVSAASAKVAVNEKNFPDQAFRAYVSQEFDKDKDGYLSEEEITEAKSISVTDKAISSLKGVEYFKELTLLSCSENKLTSLDVSKNTKLSLLACSKNVLTKVNLGNNSQPLWVFLNGNNLMSVDLSGCPNLKILSIYSNPIGKVDISKNPYIKFAYAYGEKKQDQEDPDCIKYTEYTVSVMSGNGISRMTENLFILADDNDKFDTGSGRVPDDIGLVQFKTGGIQKKCGEKFFPSYTYSDIKDDIKWKSSAPDVISVDTTGYITCKMAGTAVITASSGGASASMTVTSLYKDVTNKSDFWFVPTNYLTAKGTVKGYNNQTMFKPANDCTRAQMVTFLYRLQGEPATKSTTCKFKDVKKSDYFFKPVIWAVENGITTGVSKTKFDPKGVCTRAQTVTFLWRMAKKPGIGSARNPFKDVKEKDYFYKAVIWASNKMIVAGYSDGTFKPQGKCLRRQMVTFLYKYDKYINKK